MFSSSSTSISPVISGSMSSFQYRPTSAADLEMNEVETEQEAIEPEVRLTEKALAERLAAERAAGFSDAESKMRHEFERKAELNAAKILQAITGFDREQRAYFARVEAEIVQLALAIAAKILHREAQVDPMLLAAIVHLAIGQLKEGSAATIRVRPEESDKWRKYILPQAGNMSVNVVEDSELVHGDCILETELGTVNFNLDAQLKEVERGFFDVLAQKPKV